MKVRKHRRSLAAALLFVALTSPAIADDEDAVAPAAAAALGATLSAGDGSAAAVEEPDTEAAKAALIEAMNADAEAEVQK